MADDTGAPKDDTNWSQVDTWIRERGLKPAMAHADRGDSRLEDRLDHLQAFAGRCTVAFRFEWDSRQGEVQLDYPYPVPAPRRNEPVSLRFRTPDGQAHRVLAFVRHAIHEFAPSLISKDDKFDLTIYLHGITVQPTDAISDEIARADVGEGPTFTPLQADRIMEWLNTSTGPTTTD